MIDHIIVSNELADLFIDGSARVHYEFYGADYTKTASRSLSCICKMQLKALSLDGNTATNITCNGVANGTATVTVSGGISPHLYMGSNGANTSTVSNLGPGQYDVVVTDVLNNKVTANFTITEPTLITIPSAVESTVYYGYTVNHAPSFSR
jgi:hypothetical protein